MSFSTERFQAVLGRAEFLNGAEELFTYREFPGDPTGIVKPAHIGKEVFDTVGLRFYRAVGMTVADWRAITA